MAKSRTIVAALSAAVLLLAGGALTAALAETFKLGHSTWVGYGPFFVAQKNGYFKEEGLDLELVTIEDVKVRFAALAAGRIDAMATTVDTMPLYLKPGGTRYQYLFAVDDSQGGDGIVANKEIKSVADLKGKKVAFTEGSVLQFYINVLLKEAGLEQSDIEVINMAAGDAGSAFVSGQVDAAVTWEPWLTRGKQAPHGRLLADSSQKPGLITDVVLAPVDVIRDRKAEIQALYRGWSRSVEFVSTNPAEAHAIMAKGVGGWLKDPAVFAETLEGVVYYDAAMNEAFFGTLSNPGSLNKTIQQALDVWSGFGKLQVSVTPRELINYSAVE
jgi:NitT/TauT family transport system substrate-binding protein